LSNVSLDVFMKVVSEVFPKASFGSSIVWSSLTKGKASLLLPKDADKEKELEQKLLDAPKLCHDRAAAYIASKPALRHEVLKGLGIWDEDAAGTAIDAIEALYIEKFMRKHVKAGEEHPTLQVWETEILVGQKALEAIRRAADKEAKEGKVEKAGAAGEGKKSSHATSPFCSEVECANRGTKQCAECAQAVCGSCSHSCKKKKGCDLKFHPGEKSRVTILSDELVAIFARDGKVVSPQALEELNLLLTMFHNQSYTEGFTNCPTQQLSPYLANLQNRL